MTSSKIHSTWYTDTELRLSLFLYAILKAVAPEDVKDKGTMKWTASHLYVCVCNGGETVRVRVLGMGTETWYRNLAPVPVRPVPTVPNQNTYFGGTLKYNELPFEINNIKIAQY